MTRNPSTTNAYHRGYRDGMKRGREAEREAIEAERPPDLPTTEAEAGPPWWFYAIVAAYVLAFAIVMVTIPYWY